MQQTLDVSPAQFRATLGRYPTGVCVITTCMGEERIGMTVGSFTSISLVPPIVGFFADQASRRLPHFVQAGRYCVNVLGAEQSPVCKDFSRTPHGDAMHFARQVSPSGLPLIKDAIAWIDCEISGIIEIGDHVLVTGAVTAMHAATAASPLIFAQGTFGAFACPAQA